MQKSEILNNLIFRKSQQNRKGLFETQIIYQEHQELHDILRVAEFNELFRQSPDWEVVGKEKRVRYNGKHLRSSLEVRPLINIPVVDNVKPKEKKPPKEKAKTPEQDTVRQAVVLPETIRRYMEEVLSDYPLYEWFCMSNGMEPMSPEDFAEIIEKSY